MAKLIEQVYGQALYELAVEENKVDELWEEVSTLRTAFLDAKDLFDFMKHPQVSREEKLKLVDDSLKSKVSEDILGLLKVVVEKDRFSDIIKIFDYFISEVQMLKGICIAYVSTPVELTDVQKEKLAAKLLSTTGSKKVDIEYSIEPELIGGMVIRIGDRVVDSSIRTRLRELKKDLTKVQIKGGAQS